MRYLKIGMDDYDFVLKEDKFIAKHGRLSPCIEEFSCTTVQLIDISERGHRKRTNIGVMKKDFKIGGEADEINGKGHLV